VFSFTGSAFLFRPYFACLFFFIIAIPIPTFGCPVFGFLVDALVRFLRSPENLETMFCFTLPERSPPAILVGAPLFLDAGLPLAETFHVRSIPGLISPPPPFLDIRPPSHTSNVCDVTRL